MIRYLLVFAIACHSSEVPEQAAPQTIRCAVIGGMVETGFWHALADRYHAMTGHTVQVVASGPKPVVVDAFRKGGVDLVTFHASDAFVNLVADGLASDPQPWARNDFVIVGPADDPAHVKGEPDAVVAIGKIIAANQPVLTHASQGADGVLHDLLEAKHLVIPAAQTVVFASENQHELLDRAAEAHAYTLLGRIPFASGKVHRDGMVLMVGGDPRLRRPFLVAVATGTGPRLDAARDLVAFLRSPATQEWIAAFGKGRYDAAPLFFPITVP